MTTHMKSPSGTGHISLCGDFEPECRLTDDTWKVDCKQCKEILNSNTPIDTHYVKPWYENIESSHIHMKIGDEINQDWRLEVGKMTTHLKAPSGTGFLTLCQNFEPECRLTDDIGKTDCTECQREFWDKYRSVGTSALGEPVLEGQDHVDVYPSTFDMRDPNKDVTTHLKAKQGRLFKALCEGWVHGDLLTDRFWESNCPDCLLRWKQEQDRESGPAETASSSQVGGDHNSNKPIDTHYVKPWYENIESSHIHMKIGDETASSTQVGGDHYTVLDVQPWDAMASWMSPIEFEGFLRGCAIKYLARAGSKGPAVEDYRKARHYLDKLIEVIET